MANKEKKEKENLKKNKKVVKKSIKNDIPVHEVKVKKSINKREEEKGIKKTAFYKYLVNHKKSILKSVGIIVGLAGLFYLAFSITSVGVSYIEDTTFEKYLELFDGDETSVILLARPDCSWCQKYKPIINKVAADYDIKIHYMNTYDLDKNEREKLYSNSILLQKSGKQYDQNGNLLIATPLTLLVKEGKEVDSIEGYVEYSQLEEFLKKYQVIS